MSTLTKICVILLLVLVLVSAPIFIQKAVTDTNWREYGESQQRRANIAETTARNNMMGWEAANSALKAETDRSNQMAMNYEQAIEGKSGEIGRLSAALAEANKQAELSAAQVAAQQSTIAAQVQRNKDLSDALGQARDKSIQLADQLRQTLDKNKELAVQVENAKKRAELLDEQLQARQAEIQDLQAANEKLQEELTVAKAQGGGMSEPGAPAVATSLGQKIDGEVLAVKSDLASLNVGSASGVKAGTVFVLYRGEHFVARLRVAHVEASTCAGMLYDRVREVKQGDKASTQLVLE